MDMSEQKWLINTSENISIVIPNEFMKMLENAWKIKETWAFLWMKMGWKKWFINKLFYENSGGGVTFSGGECMLQIDFLEEVLKALKENEIHTAVDTAGHVPYEYFERILPYTDLFLYDVKCFDSDRHKRYTGIGNERILENLAKLLSTGKPVWVRIPVIPSVNDTEEEMKKIRAFLDEHGYPERVELLPYHAMGEHKYEAIGKELCRFTVPDEEKMEKLREIFK